MQRDRDLWIKRIKTNKNVIVRLHDLLLLLLFNILIFIIFIYFQEPRKNADFQGGKKLIFVRLHDLVLLLWWFTIFPVVGNLLLDQNIPLMIMSKYTIHVPGHSAASWPAHPGGLPGMGSSPGQTSRHFLTLWEVVFWKRFLLKQTCWKIFMPKKRVEMRWHAQTWYNHKT